MTNSSLRMQMAEDQVCEDNAKEGEEEGPFHDSAGLC
jgi:hypothetical protein